MADLAVSDRVGPADPAYAGDRWALALLPVACGGVLVALAIVLARHRDLGAGMLPQRPGAAEAPRLDTAPERSGAGLARRARGGRVPVNPNSNLGRPDVVRLGEERSS